MPPVTLPRLSWGDPSASHHALLVHGLGSSAHTMWRLGEAFADKGWFATAIDLRGHGNAPRTTRYRISDYAGDLQATHPVRPGGWDVVVGHSIGAAAATIAASTHPDWTTRLILLDPALQVSAERQQLILDGQLRGHDQLTEEDVRQENPHWHPLDVEHRVAATRQAARWALERSVLDNPGWNCEDHAWSLTMPTLVVGGDPAVDSLFTGDRAAAVLNKNPRISHTVIAGAGHSVHRDRPEETLQEIFGWLH
jgi:pimeloyl-ACP methyl ester carboxylesterase